MRNKASLIPFLILGLVTILGCGRFFQQANNSSNSNIETKPTTEQASGPFTLAGKEWRSVDLDQTDITVELPGEPKDMSPKPHQLPPNFSEVFTAMRLYSYDSGDFQSSYTQFAPTGKRQFQIKELGDTNMGSIRKQAPDLEYTLDVKSPTNAKYTGTFTRNGKEYELKGCVIYQKVKPLRVWAVITVYPKSNADGVTASQRIIESAVFKGSSEECE